MVKGKLKKEKAKRGIKIFIRHILKYRREIEVIVALNIVSSLIDGSSPYISGKLFDSILSKGMVHIFGVSMKLWVFMLIIWTLIQILSRVVDWLNSIRRSNFIISISNNYIVEGARKLFHLPIAFHKENKKGNSFSRIDRASDRLNQAVNFIFDFFPQFFSIIVGLFFVFWMNYLFGLILIIAMIIFVLAMIRVVKPAGEYRTKAFKAGNDAYGDIYDTMENVKTVKQSGTESYEEKRFYDKLIGVSQFFWKKIIKINIGLGAWQRTVVLIVQVTVFIISIYFIQAGKMTLGELFALNGYTAMTFAPLAYVVRWWNILSDSFVSLEKADKIFGRQEEEYDNSHKEKVDHINGKIEFKNVSFRYMDTKNQKGNEILRGVSFEINKGETVAIVGESGVGKTTIADLISGFYFPQKGQILIDDVPTNKMPIQLLRKQIAVVSQEITIFNESIGYNIKYGNFNATEKDVIRAAKEADAHEFIMKFRNKYRQKVGERGIKLSGGQRQRVAIAQAIISKAPILILDEPTSALDARTEKMVTKSLEKLMEGKTTIIIAHRLSTVKKADKIIVMDNGRVVETGKHNDLIKNKNGVYRKFYEVQKM